MHRDLKPANILVNLEHQILKIADFGLAKLFNIPIQELSLEIETLWYRAPEVLLGDVTYSLPVDMWSCGCIFAEMILGEPLFKGDSEIGQILEIFKFFGTPVNSQSIRGCIDLKFWSNKFPRFKSNKGIVIQSLIQLTFKLLTSLIG
ncbi:protein kinase domain protein [Ichthyophthirius multifiliis]|uniref:Cyclin-dependent kinase 2 homolog n=1 Tax=Ichthyophthirius multifiliis TaxID=5932 RepID=G0R048_ICHMU|nr:protein kinase domain protein [Ichthyophthirius multifiliis]EGR29147.1 protein kinase domain protein [Ichthyophthirius multifiliis]|eukprot:XP_004030383.1 protein kinase domain protein [Ichthyophthirius multifiliis]